MATVRSDVGQLHPHLPELGLPDYAAAATEQALRSHVAAAVAGLQERLTLAARAVRDGCVVVGGGGAGGGARLRAAYTRASEALQRCPAAMLCGLRAYEQQHGASLGGLLPALGDVVAGEMQSLLTALPAGFLAAARVKVRDRARG